MKSFRSLLETNVRGMIQGLRASTSDHEEEYLEKCKTEIRRDMSAISAETRANGITKLWYLHMIGHDMAWASFTVVEVMSNSKFSIKHPAYSACASSFTFHTDVALLVANLFRKDFSSKEMFETTIALNCLSCMGTPELCRDLASDVGTLLSSSRAYVRKKAILCVVRILEQSPSTWSLLIGRLRERLADDDQGVLTAAVSVLIELARRTPEHYLDTVPHLYHLLVNTNNNWLTIKLLRTFDVLCAVEPKLPPKLLPNVLRVLQETRAKSVEIEAINLILRRMPGASAAVLVALQHLAAFVDSVDRNLRYLGVVALCGCHKRGVTTAHIESVFPDIHKTVLGFVEDSDPSVRVVGLAALDQIVTSSNFTDVVDKLLTCASANPSASDQFTGTLLHLAERNSFELLSDPIWYLIVLTDLATHRIAGRSHCGQIAEHYKAIVEAHPQARKCAVELCSYLVTFSSTPPEVNGGFSGHRGEDSHPVQAEEQHRTYIATRQTPPPSTPLSGNVDPLVITNAVWILGEYFQSLPELPRGEPFASHYSPVPNGLENVVRCTLAHAGNSRSPPRLSKVCISTVLKLFIGNLSGPTGFEVSGHLSSALSELLPQSRHNFHVEVSDRASLVLAFATVFGEDTKGAVLDLFGSQAHRQLSKSDLLQSFG